MKTKKRSIFMLFMLALMLSCAGGTCTSDGFQSGEVVTVEFPDGTRENHTADAQGNISHPCEAEPMTR
jgi:hypothetical protein